MNNKGKWCPYRKVLFCQEGDCKGCQVYLERFEKLKALAEDLDKKQHLFELEMKSLVLKEQMDSFILMSMGVDDILKQLPHLEPLHKRMMDDSNLFRRE